MKDATVLVAALLVLSASALAATSAAAAGAAWCWGESVQDGTLGSSVNSSAVPVPVEDGRLYTAIAAGAHVCAVDTAGTAWCWGERQSCTECCASSPADCLDANMSVLMPLPAVSALSSAGRDDTPIPGTDGHEYAFSSVPVQVYGNAQPFVTVGVAYDYSCALDIDNRAWCWGVGNDGDFAGMLGTNQTNYTSTPVPVVGNHTFVALSVGEHRTCALDAEGSAWCWG